MPAGVSVGYVQGAVPLSVCLDLIPGSPCRLDQTGEAVSIILHTKPPRISERSPPTVHMVSTRVYIFSLTVADVSSNRRASASVTITVQSHDPPRIAITALTSTKVCRRGLIHPSPAIAQACSVMGSRFRRVRSSLYPIPCYRLEQVNPSAKLTIVSTVSDITKNFTATWSLTSGNLASGGTLSSVVSTPLTRVAKVRGCFCAEATPIC